MEENINNLNRLTEENIKSLFKTSETIEVLKSSNDKLSSKVEESKSKLKSQEDIIKENNSKIEFKIEDTKQLLKDNVLNLTKRCADIDMNIVKVIEKVSGHVRTARGDNNAPNSELDSLAATSQAIQDNVSNVAIEEIVKINKEIDTMKTEFSYQQEQFQTLSKANHELKEHVKSIVRAQNTQNNLYSGRNINNHDTVENNNPHDEAEEANNLDEDVNEKVNFAIPSSNVDDKDWIQENFQKLSDKIRIVTLNLGYKVAREDLKTYSQHFDEELELINIRLEELGKGNYIKPKATISNTNQGHAIDTSNLASNINSAINKVSKETVINELELNLNNYLPNSEAFQKCMLNIELNKEEIDRIYESIVDIRKNVLERDAVAEGLGETNEKISKAEVNIRKLRLQLEELQRNLEGDAPTDSDKPLISNSENVANHVTVNYHSGHNSHNSSSANIQQIGETVHKEDTSGGSIRDFVRNVAYHQNLLVDKVDKLSLKQESMNIEILTKVKRDLSHESTRILEDFKHDLRVSITKIEDQLREKVDRFNLDEFGKRIDNKFNVEINKKLDRTDLKKNNNLITKKIDILESKISKTLVDTLIDLQMEEAPLIIKKTAHGEKCASCNQFIHSSAHNSHSHHHNNHDQNETTNPTNTKYKLKTIHDSSFKYGTGSYSRHLANSDHIQEEIKMRASGINIQLPEIKEKPKKVNIIKPSALYKSDEFIDKQLVNGVNEELEKRVVNSDNLLRTANKAFENLEKKHTLLNK